MTDLCEDGDTPQHLEQDVDETQSPFGDATEQLTSQMLGDDTVAGCPKCHELEQQKTDKKKASNEQRKQKIAEKKKNESAWYLSKMKRLVLTLNKDIKKFMNIAKKGGTHDSHDPSSDIFAELVRTFHEASTNLESASQMFKQRQCVSIE